MVVAGIVLIVKTNGIVVIDISFHIIHIYCIYIFSSHFIYIRIALVIIKKMTTAASILKLLVS